MFRLSFFIFFGLLASLFSPSYAQTLVEKGVLDLRKWDFVENPSLELEGETFFEFGKFLLKKDFDTLQKLDYIKIPSYWNNTYKGTKPIKPMGFATYYFKILLPKNISTPLGLKITNDNLSYRVYANDQPLGEFGKAGTSPENTRLYLAPALVSLPQTDTVHVILHISNFTHRESGLSEYLFVGTYENLLQKRERRLFFDWFMIGATFIMACYHLGLFGMRRKDQSSWVFAFLCIWAFLRTGVTGESAFAQSWNFWAENPAFTKKVEYLSFYFIVMGLGMLFRALYLEDIPKWITRIVMIVALSFSILSIFLPVSLSNYLIPYFQYFSLAMILTHVGLIVRIVWRKRQGSEILLIAFIIVLVASVNDLFFSMKIIEKTIILVPMGVFIFLFAQAFLLAQRFTQSFKQVEKLTGELSEINENLELKVKQRTNEINEKNNELNMTIEELSTTIELVNRQKEEIEQQQVVLLEAKEEIELKNQNIMGSITYAKRLQTSMLPMPEQIREYLTDFFIFYRPRDVVSGDFYWFSHLNEHQAVIVVADCTGHGVPGSLMSMIGIELLNKIVNEKHLHDPATILNRLNKGIQKTFRQDLSDSKEGMDIAVCLTDKQTKTIIYSGAMNPIYYLPLPKTENSTGLQEIKADKKPVGGTKENTIYTNHTISYEQSMLVYLCTDGFQDQFGGEKNKKFLTKNLRELLLSMSEFPFSEQQEMLEQTFEAWQGKNRQTDDVTIWGFLME